MRQRTLLAAVSATVLLGCSLPSLGGPPGGAPGSSPATAPVSATLPAVSTPVLQDCGNWSRSVLCDVEFAVALDGGRWQRLDPREGVTVAPGQRLEILLHGHDQYGRDFPEHRLLLVLEPRDCGQLFDIAQPERARVSLQAVAGGGNCAIDLWIPGNLNFEWRVPLAISPAARSGYSRAEAELIVRGLYLGLLGREPDEPSFAPAVVEVQRGNLDSQVQAMTGSAEFLQGLVGVAPYDLLDRLYRGLLGRPVDPGGVRTYLNELERRRYAEVVLRILRSPEFEERLAREAGSA